MCLTCPTQNKGNSNRDIRQRKERRNCEQEKNIITVLVIAVVIAGISIYYLQGHKNYYAQIDNTKENWIEAQNGLNHRCELRKAI